MHLKTKSLTELSNKIDARKSKSSVWKRKEFHNSNSVMENMKEKKDKLK